MRSSKINICQVQTHIFRTTKQLKIKLKDTVTNFYF